MQDNNLEEYVVIHGEKMTRAECVRRLVMEDDVDLLCWKDPKKEGAEVEYSVGGLSGDRGGVALCPAVDWPEE